MPDLMPCDYSSNRNAVQNMQADQHGTQGGQRRRAFKLVPEFIIGSVLMMLASCYPSAHGRHVYCLAVYI